MAIAREMRPDYDQLAPKDMLRALRLWSHNPNYVEAADELELAMMDAPGGGE